MPTPFPGMDPYLENPHLCQGFHNHLIAHLADELAPHLRPRYYAAIEERLYRQAPSALSFVGRGDVVVDERQAPRHLNEPVAAYKFTPVSSPLLVRLPVPEEVRETYLQVRSVEDDRVVTVLEILSPDNKRVGKGRKLYLRKRERIFDALTSLVEIDLLRAGLPMPLDGELPSSDYRILVSRYWLRPDADLFAFDIRQPIPIIPLPLLRKDEEPAIELNAIVHSLYDRAAYDLRIDYHRQAYPPLTNDDAAWADDVLRTAGRRQ